MSKRTNLVVGPLSVLTKGAVFYCPLVLVLFVVCLGIFRWLFGLYVFSSLYRAKVAAKTLLSLLDSAFCVSANAEGKSHGCDMNACRASIFCVAHC